MALRVTDDAKDALSKRTPQRRAGPGRAQGRRRVHLSRTPTDDRQFRIDHDDNLPFSSFTHAPRRAVKVARRKADKFAKASRKAGR